MPRRKKTSSKRITLWVVAIALAVVATGFGLQHVRSLHLPAPGSAVPDRHEAADTGHKVTVSGKLEIDRPARDSQFGIGSDAAILLREVSMFQWRERCIGGSCSYDTIWSGRPIDSHKFHAAEGHENPALPFADMRFVAGEIRLGGLEVDPDLVAAQLAAVAYPVHANALPPNLAATLREVDGSLYAGGNPSRPAVGELRVSYRIVPAGPASLSGVQRGAKLSLN